MGAGRAKFVMVALAAWMVAALAVPAAGGARTRPSVSASIPRAVLVNTLVRIDGTFHGPGSRVVLQARRGRRWVQSAGTSVRGRSGGSWVIAWRAPRRSGELRVRAVLVGARRVMAASTARIVRVGAGHFAPGRRTVVGPPGRVVSAPAPGDSGEIVVAGGVGVQPGQALAYGYGPRTPAGFLGKVTAVSSSGSRTVLQTQPESLAAAGASGTLDLQSFHEVGPGAARDRRGPIGHAASFSAKVFNPKLGEAVNCSDGASASLTGSVSVSVTPSLHASFSLFGGLRSADFSLTGSASASLDASADASAGCTLDQTALLRNPLRIATFEGAIGPIPVVVVLEGQLYVDGEISGDAKLESSVNASASITGGIRYSGGRFSPIFSGPNTSFNFNPPTVTATGKAVANVEPALQLLLYGVAGPQLGVKGGLDFEADTSQNPWWTLTAPLSVEASLVAPPLDLNSGVLTLYKHTFHVADAGGPFGGGPQQPPPGQRTVQIDWNTDQTDIDLHVWAPDGTEAWYQNQDGLGGGSLSQDITEGFGPETFTTTDTATPLAIGVCYYADHSGADTAPPTDVTVTITEADGSQRVDHVTLNAVGDEQLVDSSPAGSATFAPAGGWCYADNGGSSP